jgi:hypothetical protein
MLGATIGRDNDQCALADDLPKQPPQQKHTRVCPYILERAPSARLPSAAVNRPKTFGTRKERRVAGLDVHSWLHTRSELVASQLLAAAAIFDRD